MQSLELLPETVELVVFSLGTAGLSLFSVYFERVAFVSIQDGNLTQGLWAGYMGVVVLLVAYAVATRKLAPTVAQFRGTAGDASD